MECFKKHFIQAVITFHSAISLHKTRDLDRQHSSLAGIAMAGESCLPFLALKLSCCMGADWCLWLLFAELLVNQIKQTPFPAEYNTRRGINNGMHQDGWKIQYVCNEKTVDKQLVLY